MNDIRRVKKIVTGVKATDGAGVRLTRVFGNGDVKDFDPFLMLDAFDSLNPDDYTKGFPWHPHRGIETITYLVSGKIEHGDSLGNKGCILDGGCQWMTAGSGIIHQEMPKPSERMLGVQLWLNLPSKDKMTVPKYNDILKSDVPVVDDGDHKIRVIAGTYKGTSGAFAGEYVKPAFLDVQLKAGREWSFVTGNDSTLFIYIFEGAGRLVSGSDELIAEKHAVLFGAGKTFWIKAADMGMRFLLLEGKPLKEPVAWGGPIVMNTQEELDLAFKELDDDTFIK
ncbi:MAG TPA: pirin family protein [Candidatus Wallbacteria bacterium]|nr:pirin family protein [Candidatus Wallbacteria bacterium]